MLGDDPEHAVDIGLADHIPHHDCRPQAPLSEELSPRCLGPPHVGNGPMHVVRPQIVPKARRDLVADSITRMSMEDHLGVPGRA